ncbi:hypothetical protein, partial [Klebsiella pneumoniae]|uniref:hypothetical protein n=1 Tax=Klebsiella pneumoniae TaxID=573 RepID=UPI002033098F
KTKVGGIDFLTSEVEFKIIPRGGKSQRPRQDFHHNHKKKWGHRIPLPKPFFPRKKPSQLAINSHRKFGRRDTSNNTVQ